MALQLNGSEILLECLLEQGVDTVFGYPGGSVLNIYDALYKYRDRITHILTAHEQGAAHAADGYARATGKVGVCIATSGPGATNLVTGIATAYMDSIPIVAITGNVSVPLLGRDSFQEVDITGVTMPITKHNFIVKDVRQLADTVRLAFTIAQSGRPGPVLVDIPKDVSGAVTEYVRQPAAGPRPIAPPKEERLRAAAELLSACEKPLIYMGGGVIASGAQAPLLRLAESQQIPVCSSMMGLGGFPPDHPLWLGMIGMHGTKAANVAARDCDLLLVCGARFSDRVAGNRTGFAPHARVVHMDVDHAEFDKNVTAAVRLAGDLKVTLEALCGRCEPRRHPDWVKAVAALREKDPRLSAGRPGDGAQPGAAKAAEGKAPAGGARGLPTAGLGNVEYKQTNPRAADREPPASGARDVPTAGLVDPMEVLHTLRRLTDDDVVIATDVGQHQMWTAQCFEQRRPRGWLTSGGLGTMGYGMGAAIGGQMGRPDSRVVLVTGDGSFHMNLNELVTLSTYRLPIVVLVMNNRVLGMVRQWQKVFYERRFSQTDVPRATDYVKLAQAFGCEGRRIETAADIEPVLKEALSLQKPVVVDCRISKDVNVLPMIPPGGTADEMIDDMAAYETADKTADKTADEEGSRDGE